MKEDVAKAWIADLRNPENKQTKRALFDGKGYCCLGRLCIVSGYSFRKSEYNRWVVAGRRDAGDEDLPSFVRHKVGLYSGVGSPKDGNESIVVGGSKYYSLADANDQGRSSPRSPMQSKSIGRGCEMTGLLASTRHALKVAWTNDSLRASRRPPLAEIDADQFVNGLVVSVYDLNKLSPEQMQANAAMIRDARQHLDRLMIRTGVTA